MEQFMVGEVIFSFCKWVKSKHFCFWKDKCKDFRCEDNKKCVVSIENNDPPTCVCFENCDHKSK